MRTTLDIAADVLQAARKRARKEGRTVGEVISELARDGLKASSPRSPAEDPRARHGFRPFSRRGGVVTNELINRLRQGDAY